MTTTTTTTTSGSFSEDYCRDGGGDGGGAATTASELASELFLVSESATSVTPSQLYRLGVVLAAAAVAAPEQEEAPPAFGRTRGQLLRAAYFRLLRSLSRRTRARLFRRVHGSFRKLLLEEDAKKRSFDDGGNGGRSEQEEEELRRALEAVAQLYDYSEDDDDDGIGGGATATLLRETLGEAIDWTVEDDVAPLIRLYNSNIGANNDRRTDEAILTILSSLLWSASLLVVESPSPPDRRRGEEEEEDDVDDDRVDKVLTSLNLFQEDALIWSDLVAKWQRQQQYRGGGGGGTADWKEALLDRWFSPPNSAPSSSGQPDEVERGSRARRPQREYLRGFLDYDPASAADEVAGRLLNYDDDDDSRKRHKGRRRRQQQQSAEAAREAELQRRIDALRQLFPDLGEGYAEIALQYFGNDVERTAAALLEPETGLPAQLRTTDRSLPRRHRRDARAAADEEEAKAITKEQIRQAQRLEEEVAYAMERVGLASAAAGDTGPSTTISIQPRDEYADDYDDQYDDMDVVVEQDTGLYDVADDYEAIKTYNRVARQAEQDAAFWEANRNVNIRSAKQQRGDRDNAASDDDDHGEQNDSTKYRGPDKMRGGRIPGRGGGRGGRGDGGGRGRGGRGRGRGRGSSKSPPRPTNGTSTAAKTDGDAAGGAGRGGSSAKPNPRKKASKMSNRRDKQKQAAAKRSG